MEITQQQLERERQMDCLQGLELLYEKINTNRSMLQLEKKHLLDDTHAMVLKSYQTDLLRVRVQINELREILTEDPETEKHIDYGVQQ
jgi:hypothetical protein